jgi:hypothetical protein
MRTALGIIVFFIFWNARAQTTASLIPQNSIFSTLNNYDSIVVYQCHVENVTPSLVSASGQTLTGKSQKSTITEKFVIYKRGDQYSFDSYGSTLVVFPNKKFSGLKIRERPYWYFGRTGSGLLNEKDLQVLLALEKKGREAIEYDFPISKYTTNQVIFKKGKNFKQLVIDGNYLISQLTAMGGKN